MVFWFCKSERKVFLSEIIYSFNSYNYKIIIFHVLLTKPITLCVLFLLTLPFECWQARIGFSRFDKEFLYSFLVLKYIIFNTPLIWRLFNKYNYVWICVFLHLIMILTPSFGWIIFWFPGSGSDWKELRPSEPVKMLFLWNCFLFNCINFPYH